MTTTKRGGNRRLGLGGAAAVSDAPESGGILELTGDPIAEAARVTALIQEGARR
jgi:hypothetical protein